MKTRIPSIIGSLRSTAICLALLCTVGMPAYAATIPVTNNTNSGAGSLRQALSDAMDGDTIDATGVSGTILLTSGELVVHTSVTINGAGADQLAVDGNHASRVFHISPGKTVTISGLTITNGSVAGGFGGGIYNDRAMLTISNCTLSGNSTISSGGGIENDGTSGSASVEILNSTISGNSAGVLGGGIYTLASGSGSSATLTITNSTISGNSAGNEGGGIFNSAVASGSATLMVTNSTISDNSADFRGGGIYNDITFGSAATLTVTNSTFSGNSANSGGGIYNDGTFGGSGGSAAVEIGDTILNAGASGANIVNSDGTVTSDGYNLSSDDASGFLTGTGDLINTDPMLDSLANNGGPTLTHALLPGSPAIDAGENFTAGTTDQRGTGFTRTFDDPAIANATGGDGTDIGAFEVQPPSSVCPQPQGYWKNNPDAWPVTELMLGDETYSQNDLLIFLNMPIGTGKNADASLILAYQLIAAKLNIANGSDPAPVSATIADADTLLSGFGGPLPYHVKPSSPSGHAMTNDANVLDNYNNTECTP
jgi:Chlamydia polymorphic membrane protein (Chlamydia_PMP) repeat